MTALSLSVTGRILEPIPTAYRGRQGRVASTLKGEVDPLLKDTSTMLPAP